MVYLTQIDDPTLGPLLKFVEKNINVIESKMSETPLNPTTRFKDHLPGFPYEQNNRTVIRNTSKILVVYSKTMHFKKTSQDRRIPNHTLVNASDVHERMSIIIS